MEGTTGPVTPVVPDTVANAAGTLRSVVWAVSVQAEAAAVPPTTFLFSVSFGQLLGGGMVIPEM